MKKIIIAALVAAILGGGAYYYTAFAPSDTIITEVNSEITALETELVSIQADIDAGRLNEAGATAARAAIENRLASINSAVVQSSNSNLTAAQKAILTDGLARMKRALIAHQTALVTIENTATKRSSGSRNRPTLITQVEDIAAEIEETITGIIPDFEPVVDLDLSDAEESATSTPDADNSTSTDTETLDETDNTDENTTTAQSEDSGMIDVETEIDVDTETQI